MLAVYAKSYLFLRLFVILRLIHCLDFVSGWRGFVNVCFWLILRGCVYAGDAHLSSLRRWGCKHISLITVGGAFLPRGLLFLWRPYKLLWRISLRSIISFVLPARSLRWLLVKFKDGCGSCWSECLEYAMGSQVSVVWRTCV